MSEIKTYDEMNKQICGLLRLAGDNVSLYAAQRIAELEAENSELCTRLQNAVELKAKVGDTLYMPWVYDGTYDIATLEIVEIELTDNEITYITDLASDNEGYLAKYNYGNFSNGDFDYIVFTDYDKAEGKLKKSNNDFDFDTWLENQPEGTFVQGGGIDD